MIDALYPAIHIPILNLKIVATLRTNATVCKRTTAIERGVSINEHYRDTIFKSRHARMIHFRAEWMARPGFLVHRSEDAALVGEARAAFLSLDRWLLYSFAFHGEGSAVRKEGP